MCINICLMMPKTNEPGQPSVPSPESSKMWLEQLTGEYRIIQEKIDKIAAFRFTIRGWSVTLVVALAFGANSLKLPPYWILSAFLPLVAFLLMERSQGKNSHILTGRAVRIEKRIWAILLLSSPDSEIAIGGMVPRLAHDLGEASQRPHVAVRRLLSMGYILFYVAQMILVVIAANWLNQFQQQAVSEPDRQGNVIINNTAPEASGPAKEVPNGQKRTGRGRP